MPPAADAQLAAKWPLIRRLAARFVRRYGWLELDDATQIAALAVWRRIDPAAGEMDEALAATIVTRALIDELRSGRHNGVGFRRAARDRGDEVHLLSLNRPAAGADEGMEYIDMLEQLEEGCLDEYDLVDLRDALARATAKLPERERLAVFLRYDEGLGQEEIGELLGVSGSRVCQILATAAYRLRPLLSEAA